jgi:hypothetical protein
MPCKERTRLLAIYLATVVENAVAGTAGDTCTFFLDCSPRRAGELVAVEVCRMEQSPAECDSFGRKSENLARGMRLVNAPTTTSCDAKSWKT